MRKSSKNVSTRQVIYIVGEGLTELYYFSHLKKLLGYRYSISPRFFDNNSIEKIEKKLNVLLREDVIVICVFDADVSRRSAIEKKKMTAFKRKYEKNSNVILCDSLQSIEYWFLLHYEDTCRYFQDAATTERALKVYIPTYAKTRKFLEKASWVRNMIADDKMITACELAEKYQGRDSYSEIYKAIKKVSIRKND
ncbi:MAG: RloB family protein [Prevotella sp.]|nr:RloB family protein [Prevotella sp.]